MPSLVGLGFHPLPGRPITGTDVSVRHAFERQSLCARFRHKGVGVQKRFFLIPLDRVRFVVVHRAQLS